MTKRELIKELMSGKKMRHDEMAKGSYCFYDDNHSGNPFRYKSEGTKHIIEMSGSWNFIGWHELEEPKVKIKLYKYAFKSMSSDDWVETIKYYEDKNSFLANIHGVKHYVRLDHTMIEVEKR